MTGERETEFSGSRVPDFDCMGPRAGDELSPVRTEGHCGESGVLESQTAGHCLRLSVVEVNDRMAGARHPPLAVRRRSHGLDARLIADGRTNGLPRLHRPRAHQTIPITAKNP